MPTDDELEALEQWILGLEYPYYGGGWLKALRIASFGVLARRPDDDSDVEALRTCLRSFTAGTADGPELRRRVVAAFLWNELPNYIPEHAEWSGLVGSDWHPTEVSVARDVVDQIVASAARRRADRHEERSAAEEFEEDESVDRDDDEVDEEALRAVFFEKLFDPASVRYFVQRASPTNDGPVDRYETITMSLESSMAGPDQFGTAAPRFPAVIGIDRRVIAVFWLN